VSRAGQIRVIEGFLRESKRNLQRMENVHDALEKSIPQLRAEIRRDERRLRELKNEGQ
jgi:wobble nucleotide-excising tRNase